MSWAELHKKSEELASKAELAFNAGKMEDAQGYYKLAAEAESQALLSVDDAKIRTVAITAISAASLWYKSGDLMTAQEIALQYHLNDNMPPFAIGQFRYILQTIWSDLSRETANIKFLPGQVFVAIKGGEVVHGGAPLDLITKKVEGIQSLFFRTAEYLLNKPHRKRGAPEKEIQEICRPWLFQAAPSSYQFSVAVQEVPQQKLFEEVELKSTEVAETFLDIVKASVESPEDALERIIPDDKYRETFLNIIRNLAPTGKSFNEMEIKSSAISKPIRIVPEARKSIGKAIRKFRVKPKESEPKDEVLTGVLRALDLNKDWIELSIEGDTVRIHDVGETVDDVIGPMVNRNVILSALKDPSGKYLLRDIEPDE